MLGCHSLDGRHIAEVPMVLRRPALNRHLERLVGVMLWLVNYVHKGRPGLRSGCLLAMTLLTIVDIEFFALFKLAWDLYVAGQGILFLFAPASESKYT